ncbi:hypothetical protein [Flavobacterium kingsejongi]|uniref:Uncharacterized protein n=1 Tax=Flavobacterium kingsejongi TaxID=1678728 RepID=A0A2S1LKX5_9FLAO|nr:hypothetical protein [Flavobacterium kingsejongi]AWG24311.1 hypothetical protein FK004_03255 [Flavobacterium kingsejongi]
MKKTLMMKSGKLTLDKMQIAKFDNLKAIKGGDGTGDITTSKTSTTMLNPNPTTPTNSPEPETPTKPDTQKVTIGLTR